MPSKSKAQQRLMGMALALRRGELERSEASEEVRKLADSDITDKDLEDFAKGKMSGKPEHASKEEESLHFVPLAQYLTEEFNQGLPEKPTHTKQMGTGQYTALARERGLANYANGMKPNVDWSDNDNYLLAVIKPEFLDIAGDVVKRLTDKGFKLAKTRTKQLTLAEAREMYKMHKKEDFYDNLCAYMSSGPSMALLLTWNIRQNPFRVMDKIKDEVRKQYAKSDMKNAMHSSDSYENMKHEASIYFNLCM